MISSRREISASEVAGHYDELDAFYRRVWGEHVHHGLWLRGDESHEIAIRQLDELVAREGTIARGTRAIDIGCGYGATARFLASELGAEMAGMTISPAQHAIALGGNRGAANPRFILGDWLVNGLPDDCFDAAIAIESSEHMADKPGFFAQAHRVLRPGGRMVVCTWLSTRQPTPRQVRWLIEPICREGRMASLGDENDYRRMAADAGFAVARVQDVTRQIAPTWPAIARTFLGRLMTHPAYVRFLVDRHARNRTFALTIARLWFAFRTGAMRYGIFTLRKEPGQKGFASLRESQ